MERYIEQIKRWPDTGRHIMAQFDDESIVVYQAYCPAIGRFAADNGYFGGGFGYNRMSWIKPNFLWMMYRCGWASKEGQETVLAVRLKRGGFDEILRQAVPSSFDPDAFSDRDAWSFAVASSSVRLQWDPDHDPYGGKIERRAIQLGLRGEALKSYGKEWIVDITDITDFVRQQYEHVAARDLDELATPSEDVYSPADVETRKRLGLDDT